MARPGPRTPPSGRPTGNRSRSTATSPAHCRCSSWTCERAPCGSSPRSAAMRTRRGRRTAATSLSYPTARGTDNCGLSISRPVASARCCSRAEPGCRRGLRVSRRHRSLTLDPGEDPRMKHLHWLVLGGVVAASVGACGKKAPETTVAPQNADSIAAAAERARQDSIAAAAADAARRAREDSERLASQRAADSAAAAARAGEEVKAALAALIHFDFDKASLRPEDQAVLDQKVAILQANSALRIRISGHCDERGSDEYNLALGNRRATAAKQYLTSHGIDASRIEIASYGEERPVDPGHNEEAWAKNRNDQFDNLTTNIVLR